MVTLGVMFILMLFGVSLIVAMAVEWHYDRIARRAAVDRRLAR